MAQTQEAAPQVGAVYSLQGTLTEACSCNVPARAGSGGPRRGVLRHRRLAHRQRTGHRHRRLGRSLAVAHIPGNILAGNWELVLLVDEHTNPEQRDALVKVFSGQLGGPLADFAQLIGTVKGSESVPISQQVRGGTGTLSSPASSRPRWSPTEPAGGRHHPAGLDLLHRSRFAGLGVQGDAAPGEPAPVRDELEYEGRNAIQAEWKMEHVA